LGDWRDYDNTLNTCYIAVVLSWIHNGYLPLLQELPPPRQIHNSPSLLKAPTSIAAQHQSDVDNGYICPGESSHISPLLNVIRDSEVEDAIEILRQNLSPSLLPDNLGDDIDTLNSLITQHSALLPGLSPVKCRLCLNSTPLVNTHILDWPFSYNKLLRFIALIPEKGSACKIDLTAMYRQVGLHPIAHSLYSYSFQECLVRRNIAIALLSLLGWPINWKKVTFPSTSLVYLGIHIDTITRSLSIPANRITLILHRLLYLRRRGFFTVRDLRSLAGRFEWVASVFPQGRPYISSIHRTTSHLFRGDQRLTLSSQVETDLLWWEQQLSTLSTGDHPGWSRVWHRAPLCPITILSDASGLSGFGVIFGGTIIHGQWHLNADTPPTAFELLPLIVALQLLGPQLRGRILVFTTDNIGTAIAINRGSSSSPALTPLLKAVARLAAQYSISILGDWSSRVFLPTCDRLSKDTTTLSFTH